MTTPVISKPRTSKISASSKTKEGTSDASVVSGLEMGTDLCLGVVISSMKTRESAGSGGEKGGDKCEKKRNLHFYWLC